MEERRACDTHLLLLGTSKDILPIVLLNRVGNAHRLGDDVDAAQDAAAGGGGEGEDFDGVSGWVISYALQGLHLAVWRGREAKRGAYLRLR